MGKSKGALEAVDAKALYEALENRVGMVELSPEDAVLTFGITREAYSGAGYHEGTEFYQGTLPLHEKSKFGPPAIGGPPFVSEFIVFPCQLDGDMVDAPEEYDDEDGEVAYCHPDPDFVWQELENTLGLALDELPEWTFDPDLRAKGLKIENCWVLS